jgi:hypothetical protein
MRASRKLSLAVDWDAIDVQGVEVEAVAAGVLEILSAFLLARRLSTELTFCCTSILSEMIGAGGLSSTLIATTAGKVLFAFAFADVLLEVLMIATQRIFF